MTRENQQISDTSFGTTKTRTLEYDTNKIEGQTCREREILKTGSRLNLTFLYLSHR